MHWMGEYIGARQISWTPTYSSSSGALGSVTTNRSIAYQLGHLIICFVDCTITNNNTATGNFNIFLPSACVNGPFCGHGRELLLAGTLFCGTQSSATSFVAVRRYDATYGLTTGSRLIFHHAYEVNA